jgi:hypothetical protein
MGDGVQCAVKAETPQGYYNLNACWALYCAAAVATWAPARKPAGSGQKLIVDVQVGTMELLTNWTLGSGSGAGV